MNTIIKEGQVWVRNGTDTPMLIIMYEHNDDFHEGRVWFADGMLIEGSTLLGNYRLYNDRCVADSPVDVDVDNKPCPACDGFGYTTTSNGAYPKCEACDGYGVGVEVVPCTPTIATNRQGRIAYSAWRCVDGVDWADYIDGANNELSHRGEQPHSAWESRVALYAYNSRTYRTWDDCKAGIATTFGLQLDKPTIPNLEVLSNRDVWIARNAYNATKGDWQAYLTDLVQDVRNGKVPDTTFG